MPLPFKGNEVTIGTGYSDSEIVYFHYIDRISCLVSLLKRQLIRLSCILYNFAICKDDIRIVIQLGDATKGMVGKHIS